MSPPWPWAGPPGARPGERGLSWPWLLAFAATGLVLGYLWGIADQPRYSATASVVVNPPPGGEVEQAARERLAALGSSEEVATEAASVLGSDVAGADLLSDVTVAPAPSGGTILITAESELPDFAVAVADGYAEAMATIAADEANAAYRRASERVEERLAELDGGSEEAAALGERIADLEAARATDPLTLGAAATLPDSPSENRSAAASAGVGLVLGLLLGAIVLLVGGSVRSGRPAEPLLPVPARGAATPEEPEPDKPEPEPFEPEPFEPEPEPEPEPEVPVSPEDHLDRLGVGLLASVAGDPDALVVRDTDLVLSPSGATALTAAAEALGLTAADPPRTLAVLDLASSSRGVAVAIGLAAVALDRTELSILVVDADLAGSSLAQRLGVDPEPGLGDYLEEAATPREVLRTVAAGLPSGGSRPLVCVPAGVGGREHGAALDGGRFEALVERLPRAYDVVLFAGPAAGDPDAVALASMVDSVALVASGADADFPAELDRTLEELADAVVSGVILAGTKRTPS